MYVTEKSSKFLLKSETPAAPFQPTDGGDYSISCIRVATCLVYIVEDKISAMETSCLQIGSID